MKKCYYCGEYLDDHEIELNQNYPGEKATCLKCLDKSEDCIARLQKGYNN